MAWIRESKKVPVIYRLPGDRVKREGHCSEYEKSEIAKEK